jgi:glycosyltransferase involved in cell wall biosynthesis
VYPDAAGRTWRDLIRVAYLQSGASGYTDSCLRALAADPSVSLFISLPPGTPNAPFEPSEVPADVIHEIGDFRRDRSLERALRRFDPDVLMVVSWHHANYRWCLRQSHRAVRVLCMDNQWLATPKQRLGVATSAVHVRRYYEAAFLPGGRQREFARRLGFPDDRIYEGFYSADTNSFGPPAVGLADRPRAFVFVGRLVEAKGISTLAAAYREYRAAVDDPWNLIVAGVGPESSRLIDIDGVEPVGFVQPRDLPEVFRRARFLALPSKFEPFGVVVHEAVCSGLGVLCTDKVGAAERLVEPGGNGMVFPVDAPHDLAQAMTWAHHLSDNALGEVAALSGERARTFSPERWAATVLQIGREVTRS